MSFWSRLLRKRPEAPPEPPTEEPREQAEPPASAIPPIPPEIVRLANVGEPDGASVAEALATLQGLRATPDEAVALEELVRRAARKPLPDALALSAASALVDRGEPASARKLLEAASSSPALLLRADLASDRGDLGGALALIERVLLRDFDHPGARERHARWRDALGLDPVGARKRADAGTTTVATSGPDAPFLLLREVARGGAGAVYEAEDRELGRRVALKVYHRPERDRAQLLHEAQVAASLAGPGVVRVFDADPDHGWLALEWAPMGALRDHVKSKARKAFVPPEKWALPLATTLGRAHAAGWVHHDVKPANVLMHAPDAPVLADFGTARRTGEPSPPGSFGYVSPERMAGRASDPRDDVYGFGRILEDVLDAVGDPELTARWRPLTSACVGPDEGRPADGRALSTRIRIETASKH